MKTINPANFSHFLQNYEIVKKSERQNCILWNF